MVRTLIARLLPQQPDSGLFVRPLQPGPPRPALGLHSPQHRSAPSHFLQPPFLSMIFGLSLVILSLTFPNVQHLVCHFSAFILRMGPMLFIFSMTSSRRMIVSTTLSEVAARHRSGQRWGWAHNSRASHYRTPPRVRCQCTFSLQVGLGVLQPVV